MCVCVFSALLSTPTVLPTHYCNFLISSLQVGVRISCMVEIIPQGDVLTPFVGFFPMKTMRSATHLGKKKLKRKKTCRFKKKGTILLKSLLSNSEN